MSGEIHICDKNSDKELVIDAQDILDFVADYGKQENLVPPSSSSFKKITKGGIMPFPQF